LIEVGMRSRQTVPEVKYLSSRYKICAFSSFNFIDNDVVAFSVFSASCGWFSLYWQ